MVTPLRCGPRSPGGACGRAGRGGEGGWTGLEQLIAAGRLILALRSADGRGPQHECCHLSAAGGVTGYGERLRPPAGRQKLPRAFSGGGCFADCSVRKLKFSTVPSLIFGRETGFIFDTRFHEIVESVLSEKLQFQYCI